MTVFNVTAIITAFYVAIVISELSTIPDALRNKDTSTMESRLSLLHVIRSALPVLL